LKLDITSIIKNNGGIIKFQLEDYLEDLRTGLGTVSFTGPVEFSGSVANNNGMLVLKGLAKVSYETFCDRCGERIERELAITVDEGIVEKSETVDDTVEENEEDWFTYSGNTLELDRILADYILTNIPMSHICREDCPGIDSGNGAELEGESGGTDSVDSRFEALKGFFD